MAMSIQGIIRVQISHPEGIIDRYYDLWLKPVLQLNKQSHSSCKRSKGFIKN